MIWNEEPAVQTAASWGDLAVILVCAIVIILIVTGVIS